MAMKVDFRCHGNKEVKQKQRNKHGKQHLIKLKPQNTSNWRNNRKKYGIYPRKDLYLDHIKYFCEAEKIAQ